MTITFENENEVIVYALEKIISYARENRYIFVAQSIWWIASVIGLIDRLATDIDNLRIRSEANQAILEGEQSTLEKELAPAHQDHLSVSIEGSCVHPERISQIDNSINDSYEVESSELEPERATLIIESAKEFLCRSQKERKDLKQKRCVLS